MLSPHPEKWGEDASPRRVPPFAGVSDNSVVTSGDQVIINLAVLFLVSTSGVDI